TVDVSMETLASVWARDPGDLRDLAEKRHEPPAAFGESSKQQQQQQQQPGGFILQLWMQDSRRPIRLQDTLLQREEELARLQEENNKLRGFLSSSFVRNLEQKAKKLTADGTRRRPKRNLDGEAFSRQQVSKRVCRNLTAEFCSESFETSTHSEPNLDLWVLQTLGLKDRDTIDTSNEFSSECIGGLVYDTAVTPSSSTHDYRYRELDVAAAEHPGTTRSHDTSTASEICSDNPPLFWSHRWTPSPTSPTHLAFSMLLSPSSSVKTHSFPQGQAFVRKDTGGRWSFTWVPKQGP
uniref:Geminin coiled-coil domain containing n=1 Tax=Stegastes partitus TaxID=144197 RepID=A0A3B5A2L7_9TELE